MSNLSELMARMISSLAREPIGGGDKAKGLVFAKSSHSHAARGFIRVDLACVCCIQSFSSYFGASTAHHHSLWLLGSLVSILVPITVRCFRGDAIIILHQSMAFVDILSGIWQPSRVRIPQRAYTGSVPTNTQLGITSFYWLCFIYRLCNLSRLTTAMTKLRT